MAKQRHVVRALAQRCRRYGYSLVLTLALLTPVVAQQPITFRYFYDELGQLVKVVDSTGIVIEYVYDAVGNMLEIKRSTLAAFVILDFTPRQGAAETLVTIQGQGFSTTLAENLVQFNGVAAVVTTATPQSMQTTVPVGATTGRITVTVGGATATSEHDFTVLQVPVITAARPNLGLPGLFIPSFRVEGNNLTHATFSFVPSGNPPSLSASAPVIDATGTSATFTVLVGAGGPGTFVVVATNPAGSSSAIPDSTNILRILDPAQDDDGDGLTNAEELARGTHPLQIDTDGDGFRDGLEVALGADPLDGSSVPEFFPQGRL